MGTPRPLAGEKIEWLPLNYRRLLGDREEGAGGINVQWGFSSPSAQTTRAGAAPAPEAGKDVWGKAPIRGKTKSQHWGEQRSGSACLAWSPDFPWVLTGRLALPGDPPAVSMLPSRPPCSGGDPLPKLLSARGSGSPQRRARARGAPCSLTPTPSPTPCPALAQAQNPALRAGSPEAQLRAVLIPRGEGLPACLLRCHGFAVASGAVRLGNGLACLFLDPGHRLLSFCCWARPRSGLRGAGLWMPGKQMTWAGSRVGGARSRTRCPRARSLVPVGLRPCLGRARGWQLGLVQTWAQPCPRGKAGTMGGRVGRVDPLQVVGGCPRGQWHVVRGTGSRWPLGHGIRVSREHGRPRVGGEGGWGETADGLVCVYAQPWTMGCEGLEEVHGGDGGRDLLILPTIKIASRVQQALGGGSKALSRGQPDSRPSHSGRGTGRAGAQLHPRLGAELRLLALCAFGAGWYLSWGLLCAAGANSLPLPRRCPQCSLCRCNS